MYLSDNVWYTVCAGVLYGIICSRQKICFKFGPICWAFEFFRMFDFSSIYISLSFSISFFVYSMNLTLFYIS